MSSKTTYKEINFYLNTLNKMPRRKSKKQSKRRKKQIKKRSKRKSKRRRSKRRRSKRRKYRAGSKKPRLNPVLPLTALSVVATHGVLTNQDAASLGLTCPTLAGAPRSPCSTCGATHPHTLFQPLEDWEKLTMDNQLVPLGPMEPIIIQSRFLFPGSGDVQLFNDRYSLQAVQKGENDNYIAIFDLIASDPARNGGDAYRVHYATNFDYILGRHTIKIPCRCHYQVIPDYNYVSVAIRPTERSGYSFPPHGYKIFKMKLVPRNNLCTIL